MGSPKTDTRTLQIRTKLNDFYELRNGIIHSILQNTGIGAATFSQWVQFFRIFAPAFVDALNEAHSKFSAEVAVTKAGAA